MLPNQNSNSYSTQGWLAQIYSLLEGGIGLGLVNGIVINDTAFFVQDTKPTTRLGGDALVAGDKWYNTAEGTEWFWNGTYWLSTQKTTVSSYDTVNSNEPIDSGVIANVQIKETVPGNGRYPLFVESVEYRAYVGTADASNYWTLDLRVGTLTSTGTFGSAILGEVTPVVLDSAGIVQGYESVNAYREFVNNNFISIYIFGLKTGTPSNLTPASKITLREVYS